MATAACSTRAERPQRTSDRRVMTWYVALRQSQTRRIWGLLWRSLQQTAWSVLPSNVVLRRAGNDDSGGFRGGRAGASPSPHFGDGLTPSLPICDNCTVLWRHHRQFYLFKHEKHGTQNIQNDCHQWLCDSFRVHQIRFRSRLRPEPR